MVESREPQIWIIIIIMACISIALFRDVGRSKRFTESIIHSYPVIPVMVSYLSSHSCPGADWRKRGCHIAPTAPPTTTNIHIHSHSHKARWVKCLAQGHNGDGMAAPRASWYSWTVSHPSTNQALPCLASQVSHPSTNQALLCLASEIWRDQAYLARVVRLSWLVLPHDHNIP